MGDHSMFARGSEMTASVSGDDLKGGLGQALTSLLVEFNGRLEGGPDVYLRMNQALSLEPSMVVVVTV
jgi:hypothetical protein